MSFTLSSDPIETAPSHPLDAAGGYVVFEGRVRNLNEGRQVLSLEYEAFDEMAIKTGNEVLAEALTQFPIQAANCRHRTGHLQIGDVAIWVEVASAHRKAAFEACDWIVDEVKRRVPIWKKEHYAEGDSGWINCEKPRVDSEDKYYERQVRLPEVCKAGQEKLRKARVLVVGAGGLGSPALMYLAAAGVGTIGIADFDDLDESNLHRQILYGSSDIGQPKSELAARRLHELNPYVTVVPHNLRATPGNVGELIRNYDLVLDGTDNFHTKFLLNDACVQAAKPVIQASIYQYEGQLLVITPGAACLRCLWPQAPDAGCVGSCAEVGVLGVVPGVFGSLQATEAVKLILGMPSPLREGKMLLFDLLEYRQQMVGIDRDPRCPACGSGRMEQSVEVDANDVDLADYLLIDIRDSDEIEAEPISVNMRIPVDNFDPTALPQADRYLLVCASGVRSLELTRRLRAQGDDRFFSLAGGAPALRSLVLNCQISNLKSQIP
jgi:sulfur-carrier protein adenylyltransferase/sulfurtransferase